MKGTNMLSADAMHALRSLEDGARFNTMHSTARELLGAGLAYDDWGNLAISEGGRRLLRSGVRRIEIHSDEQACDMSRVHMMQIPKDAQIDRTPNGWWINSATDRAKVAAIDPMMSPQHVFKHQIVENTPVVFKEPPAEPLPIAESRKQEMLRAAGVASGITGVWPDERWVNEFVRALDGVLEADGTKQENTP
jgi:hypothetical protein